MASSRRIIEVELIEIIGTGSLGIVYKAKRTDTKETVALKSVRLVLATNEREEQTKLLRERFDLSVQLDHVNLVRHIHHQEPPVRNPAQAPTYEIIMEYCDGPTLQDMIKNFPMTPVILQKWTKEILQGVGYLHQRGLIHRDIKGENILLTSNDTNNCQVKIADLGEVKVLLSEATKSREVSHEKGTWAFMSPEMITGAITGATSEENIWVGRKADVWSLGCVVTEMINGGLPRFYKRRNQEKWIRVNTDIQVMYFVGGGGSPTVPAGLPSAVEDFIKKCLMRDPKQRPTVSDLRTCTFFTSTEEEVGSWHLPPRELLYRLFM